MNFINSTIVRVSLAYLFGIIAGIFFTAEFTNDAAGISISFLSVVIILFVLLGVSVLIARKQLFPNPLFGTLLLLLFFFLGSYKYQITQPQFQPDHYSHDILLEEQQYFQINISEILKPDTHNNKYIAEVERLHGNSTQGKILVNILKDTINTPNKIDDRILVKTKAVLINTPLNPDQFDYKNYMKSVAVHYQLQIKNNQIALTEKGPTTLRGLAENSRSFIIKKLKETPIKPKEQAIIQALVLGQKQDIDKKLYGAYAAAGAIHILAVSGLHVGIIFFILKFLLSSLLHLKKGAFIKSVLIVACLWLYAFITGLSPSVCRAVTMFSCLAFAGLLNRRSSTINSLALSFIILLFYNPLWVLHVGFQLSYLAVLSIILIQPKLYNYYMPRNYMKRKAWGILTVTLAAQVGVLPLSVYYFHQFPGLFFITNSIVLPFLGLLLGIGILVLLLATLNILPSQVAFSYGWLIEKMNLFIGWVASQDRFLFRDIPFSEWNMLGCYGLIVSLFLFWTQPTFKRLTFSLGVITLFLGTFLLEIEKQKAHSFVVFQKSRQTMIGIKNATEMRLFKTDTATFYSQTYPVKSYKIANHINNITEEILPKYFKYCNTPVIVIDSLGVYPNISEAPIIILTESAKVNLNRLIDSLQPTQIIADGTNYYSSVARWNVTCTLRNIPFHYTGKDGAFVLNRDSLVAIKKNLLDL